MTLSEALETLTLLPNWEQRYTYLIELARTLPIMPESEKIAANLVPGCTSQVWLTHSWNDDKLNLHLESDALIVKGLLALIHLAYNNQSRETIRATNLPERLAPTGLLQHLSPNRRNGFASVTSRIQTLAA